MSPSKTEVHDYILGKLQEISDDCDYSNEIGFDSLLFTQLGFESLDVVVLGVAIQNHFGCTMPFAELFAELGQSRRDLSVRELIDFSYKHANGAASKAVL